MGYQDGGDGTIYRNHTFIQNIINETYPISGENVTISGLAWSFPDYDDVNDSVVNISYDGALNSTTSTNATGYYARNISFDTSGPIRVTVSTSNVERGLSAENTQTVYVTPACGAITSDALMYRDIEAAGTCYTLNASDITFDCQGNTVGYANNETGSAFVFAPGTDNITVKNCVASTPGDYASVGINVSASTNATIENVTTTEGSIGSNSYSIFENGTLYRVEEFRTVGNHTFTPPAGVTEVEYLIVAGGGGGAAGDDDDGSGAGGGAGGLLEGTTNVSQQTYDLTVGAGGYWNGSAMLAAENSSAFGFDAIAGGAGLGRFRAADYNGGSGGGQHRTGPIGNGTPGQGNDGGAAGYPGQLYGAAGGGGGAGSVGGDGSNYVGGDGGDGIVSTITGSAVYYAGGGGGGGEDGNAHGSGGLGGGASGGTLWGQNATPNTGGGGGGGAAGGAAADYWFVGQGGIGGDGGSGIIIVRYVSTSETIALEATGADGLSIINSSLDSSNGTSIINTSEGSISLSNVSGTLSLSDSSSYLTGLIVSASGAAIRLDNSPSTLSSSTVTCTGTGTCVELSNSSSVTGTTITASDLGVVAGNRSTLSSTTIACSGSGSCLTLGTSSNATGMTITAADVGITAGNGSTIGSTIDAGSTAVIAAENNDLALTVTNATTGVTIADIENITIAGSIDATTGLSITDSTVASSADLVSDDTILANNSVLTIQNSVFDAQLDGLDVSNTNVTIIDSMLTANVTFRLNLSNIIVNDTTITSTTYDAILPDASNDTIIATNASINMSKVAFNSTNDGSIEQRWYLDALILAPDFNPSVGADVTVNDTFDDSRSLATGANGRIPQQVLTESLSNATNTTYYSNYTLKAVNNGLSKNATFNLTTNQDIQLQLIAIPPTYSNPQTNATNTTPKRFEPIRFNLSLSDDVELDGYVFSWNGTGVWTNDSFVAVNGSSHLMEVNQSSVDRPGRTSVGWRVYVNDTLDNVNVTEVFTFEVANTAPGAPNLSYPADNESFLTDRAPTFNWTEGPDVDNDDLNYTIQVALDESFASIVTSANVTGEQFTPSTPLDFETYWWRVRSDDGLNTSNYSEPFNFTLVSLVSIELVDGSLDFGDMSLGEVNDTTNGNPAPITVINTGNLEVNITVNATEIWVVEPLDTVYYQAKVREKESGAYNTTGSSTNYLNLSNISKNLIQDLYWDDEADEAYIDIRVQAPFGELPGERNSTIWVDAS